MKICVLKIKSRFQNYSFICVYAPMEDKSEVEKDQLEEQFERTYIHCPSYDIKIIIGDFNAKVGNESWETSAYMMKAMVMKCDS
jgi:hypothetical protein